MSFKSPSGAQVKDDGSGVWGRLELRLSKDESTVFELKGDKAQIVGRAQGSDVQIALPHISATHCTVREAGTTEDGYACVKIMDLSSNGTSLNKEPVGRNLERELRDGDSVTFTKVVGTHTEYPCMTFRAAASHRRAKRARASPAEQQDQNQGPTWIANEILLERRAQVRLQEKLDAKCKEHALERDKRERVQDELSAKDAQLREAQSASQRVELLRAEQRKAAEEESASKLQVLQTEHARLQEELDSEREKAAAAAAGYERKLESAQEAEAAALARVRKAEEAEAALQKQLTAAQEEEHSRTAALQQKVEEVRVLKQELASETDAVAVARRDAEQSGAAKLAAEREALAAEANNMELRKKLEAARAEVSAAEGEKLELGSKLRATTNKSQDVEAEATTLRRQKEEMESRLHEEQSRAACELARVQEELLAAQASRNRDAVKIRQATDRAESAERQVTLLNNRILLGQSSIAQFVQGAAELVERARRAQVDLKDADLSFGDDGAQGGSDTPRGSQEDRTPSGSQEARDEDEDADADARRGYGCTQRIDDDLDHPCATQAAAVPGEGGESENSQHDSAGVEATQAAVLACHTRPEATQPARRVHFDAQPPQIKPPTPVPAGPEAAAPEPEDGAEAGKDGAESGRATGKRRRLDDTSQGEEGLAQSGADDACSEPPVQGGMEQAGTESEAMEVDEEAQRLRSSEELSAPSESEGREGADAAMSDAAPGQTQMLKGAEEAAEGEVADDSKPAAPQPGARVDAEPTQVYSEDEQEGEEAGEATADGNNATEVGEGDDAADQTQYGNENTQKGEEDDDDDDDADGSPAMQLHLSGGVAGADVAGAETQPYTAQEGDDDDDE